MSARTWSPLLFPYNCQLAKLRYFKLMHYATNIIAIRCKFKYSTRATLNVNSARAKLNKPDKTECSAKQFVVFRLFILNNSLPHVRSTPHRVCAARSSYPKETPLNTWAQLARGFPLFTQVTLSQVCLLLVAPAKDVFPIIGNPLEQAGFTKIRQK